MADSVKISKSSCVVSLQDPGGNKEVDELKSTVAELKERIWQLRAESDELDQQHRQKQVRVDAAESRE